MAAPPNLPPLPPIDPTGPLFLGFNEPPPRPAFMASANNDDVQHAGQNYDRSNDLGLPPPPPPQAHPSLPPPPPHVPIDPQQALDLAAGQGNQPSDSNSRRGSDSGEGSGSGSDSGEDDDEQTLAHNRWRPIEEDKSEPCEDELAYISSKDERSALDRAYWEKETFFDIDDPEIIPVEGGRIDWLVEKFNGTQDDPNVEPIMRSPIFRIGGYDWRIKLYPKGNNTDYLSVYIECVSMQSPDFEESENDMFPALPFLTDLDVPKKRRSVAVQLAVVMYNPAEPRVYEYQMDAHQFTKKSADYGWTRFTRYSRRDFAFRNHGQRQAILRDDRLAFSAYIKVVDDPTGCMWAHGTNSFEDSVALTGLRPFSPHHPVFAAEIPLLHFAPFRDFIYRCEEGKIVFWFQTLLWKMMSRRRSKQYGAPHWCVQSDTIAWLRFAARWLKVETDAGIVNDLIGTFDPESGAAVGANRLRTKMMGSVQAAVDAHATAIETPALLTLELERQEFDREKRTWNKIMNKVEMQNKIVVAGTPYTLFAFATHCGDLTSNMFNLYVRPNGLDNGWYAYTDGSVTRLTHKQAIGKHCGWDEPSSPVKTPRHLSSRLDSAFRGVRPVEDLNEVAHVVQYVRDDCAYSAFAAPCEETWDAPQVVRKGKLPQQDQQQEPPPTSAGERFPSTQVDIDAEEAARKYSALDAAGHATPNCWPMDGEDVVMSDAIDADGSSLYMNEDPVSSMIEENLRTATFEHLGREYYKGQLVSDKYHGQGHLIAMNGDEYTGSFHLGQKSGHGTMTYASTGNVYTGSWLEDQHHGHGTLTEKKTRNVFEGGWKHGKKHGEFMLKGTVTDEDKGCCSICYDRQISTAFYDCGHVVACKECAHRIDQCPVCRKRVLARLELFGVSMTFE